MSVEMPGRLLASPCIGTCRLDAATGWCVGCARDADELTRWRELGAQAQAAVWADLPRRKTQLGLTFRLKPWPPAQVLRHLAAMAALPDARLAIGPYAALTAEGLVLENGMLRLKRDGIHLLLRLDPTLRLFELEDRQVLAVHRARLGPMAYVISASGPDAAALDPQARNSARFDLGHGSLAARVTVRTRNAAAARYWQARCGSAFDGAMPPGDVTTIVDLPIGRLEHRGPPPVDQPVVPGLPEAYVACVALLKDGRNA